MQFNDSLSARQRLPKDAATCVAQGWSEIRFAPEQRREHVSCTPYAFGTPRAVNISAPLYETLPLITDSRVKTIAVLQLVHVHATNDRPPYLEVTR
jgi:hypothetical protein